ncbi:MAG: hypothetical protein M3378_05400 [Actinomycetota bacterium]|nr:hypothetical protein [Actinomycetota bacterium]MDQ3679973.1 hypothetical protein [Actinomycetota bacterium]
MVQPGHRPAVSGPRPDGGDDWTIQAADTVERLVGTVRDKTSVPLTTVARGVVFGLMAAIMGVVVAVLVAVTLVRVIDVVTGEGNVWIAHLTVGGIFSVVGGVLLRKATTKTAR